MILEENGVSAEPVACLCGVSLYRGRNTCEFVVDGTTVRCEVFLPGDYSEQCKYPVMLFLHGDGLNGKSSAEASNSNEALVMRRAFAEHDEQFIGIVPAAKESWMKTPDDGHVVRPRKSIDMRKSTPSAQLLAVEKLLDCVIDGLNADRDRVYLTGYSRGAMASWYLLAKTPEKFAAAVLCCGAGDPKIAHMFFEVPLRIYMGDADPLVDYECVKNVYKEYAAAGGKGTFVRCVGATHDLAEFLRNDKIVVEWLFAQKKQI